MTVDILPAIHIPVVIVVWNYPGLAPEDMERRVVLIAERAYSTTVNGISRIESQCIQGIGVMKVYFQPGSDLGTGIAQIGAVSNILLRIAPPGIQPPAILQFDASNVPVAQLTVSSKNLPEQALFDYGLNFIRVRLFTIPGLSTPAPFGGKNRQIMVSIDPAALALPIATLSQTDRLRVYFYPDQKTASSVKVGDRVEIADVTRPDVKLSAAVSRTSGELDPKTRTLLVEIDLDNREGKILAGSFVQVTLFIRSTAVAQIPAQCLVMRGDNPWVAVVGGDNKVQFRPVNIYESDGRKIQLASGVTEGERVVFNPLSTLTDGEHVQPVDG